MIGFVVGAILIASVGAVCDWGAKYLASTHRLSDYHQVAGILRYYWYRTSDWAVPFGVVFLGARALNWSIRLELFRLERDSRKYIANISRGLFHAILWFCLALTFYWIARYFFCRLALQVATAGQVEGSIPAPRPTECVSYLAALDAFAILLILMAVVARTVFRGRSERPLDSLAYERLYLGAALWLTILAVLAPVWRFASYVDLRGTVVAPRSAPPKDSIAQGWLDACRWVRANTDVGAVFLVPRGCDSFKWEARRAEAGSWKEIPQDANSIVQWRRKMEAFYENPGAPEGSPMRWNQALVVVFINKGRAQVARESEEFGFDYAIVEAPPYTVATNAEALRRWKEFLQDAVYQNDQFVVLRFNKASALKDETL